MMLKSFYSLYHRKSEFMFFKPFTRSIYELWSGLPPADIESNWNGQLLIGCPQYDIRLNISPWFYFFMYNVSD